MLYMDTTSSLSVPLLDILERFHDLPVVNSTAMNAGSTCIFSNYSFLSGFMPRRIAGSYDNSVFSFKEPPYPTNSVGGFFIPTLLAFITCKFFDSGHSDQCDVIPHCNFDLHFKK